MKICTQHSANSIVPLRIMPHCRLLPALTKVTLLSAVFSMLWVFVIVVMKAFISMDVEWLGDHDKFHIVDFDGKATHLQKPYIPKVFGLSFDADKLSLKPRELNKESSQSKKRASDNKDNEDNEYHVAGDTKDNVNERYNVPKNDEKDSTLPSQHEHSDAASDDGQNEEKSDSLDNKQNHDTPELLTALNTKVSSSVEGQQNRDWEISSTFIPNEPDTSPLRQPPDIPKRFLIEETNYCRRRPNLQIIAYIHSSISRVKERMDTRRSWANASAYDMGPMNVSVGAVFMVGRAKNKLEQKIVQEESEKYHDIVQGSYGDHYRLLTYKGLASLYWINKHCAHVPWTLHSDDDTHIDIFLYHRALQQLDDESKQKFVCSNMKGPALRVGRYKVRYEEYPAKKYPLYCSGGVWFLQTKFIKRLLLATKTVPFLWVDDAYITGLLARRAGIGQLPFQQYYGGPHARPERIGKEVAWFVKFASRAQWWQKIVEYHKKHSMHQLATLEPLIIR